MGMIRNHKEESKHGKKDVKFEKSLCWLEDVKSLQAHQGSGRNILTKLYVFMNRVLRWTQILLEWTDNFVGGTWNRGIQPGTT
jgi:hypothetical protein